MTDRMEAAMPVEAPERIWIESEGGCPYFYREEELSDVDSPVTEYVRADKLRSEIAHAQEEAMDFAVYAERIMREILDSGITAQTIDEIEQENRLIRERNKRLEYEVKKLAARNDILEAQNAGLRMQLDEIKKTGRVYYEPTENEGSEV